MRYLVLRYLWGREERKSLPDNGGNFFANIFFSRLFAAGCRDRLFASFLIDILH
jgi:hypothetical protein